MKSCLVALAVLTACNSSEPTGAAASARPAGRAWAIPDGWKSETIPFPLEFAPSLAHRGAEELRFPPDFLQPGSPGYWSYAFIWRTEDPADLDGRELAAELTAYFQGLIAAVDKEKRRVDAAARASIAVRAEMDATGRFTLSAHVIDAFRTAAPVDLAGWAARTRCGGGALWVFVLAPAASPLRAQLDALARSAGC